MARSRATSFGEVAALYDKRRPSYPEDAVDHVLSLVASPRTLIDVGCGTGKATVQFEARGLSVIGVEASEPMAAVARRNLSAAASVVTSRFEDWEGPGLPVDVVVSAQAWHWIEMAVGVPKAAALLRPGGVFAVMANMPREGGHDLRTTLDPVYESVVGGLVETTGMLNWLGSFDELEAAVRESGLFEPTEPWQVDWDQPLDGDSYVELMQTHSDYLLLEPAVLERLVSSVRTAIEAAGGVVTMRYRTRVSAAIRR